MSSVSQHNFWIDPVRGARSITERLPLGVAFWLFRFLVVLGALIAISGTEASASSPRTALIAPIELSNNAQLHTKFTVRIDGEFWIEINYLRKFRFSAGHPAPLTEFF